MVRRCGTSENIEQLVDSGEITQEDADAVKAFGEFLKAAGPRPGQEGHDPARAREAYDRYFPES